MVVNILNSHLISIMLNWDPGIAKHMELEIPYKIIDMTVSARPGYIL